MDQVDVSTTTSAPNPTYAERRQRRRIAVERRDLDVHVHDAPPGRRRVHQHGEGVRQARSRGDTTRAVCSPPDTWTVTLTAARRRPRSQPASAQPAAVHAVHAERACRSVPASGRRSACRRATSTPASRVTITLPGGRTVSDRTNSKGLAIFRVTPSRSGTARIRAARVLRRRATDRPPGPPDGRPESAEGHRLSGCWAGQQVPRPRSSSRPRPRRRPRRSSGSASRGRRRTSRSWTAPRSRGRSRARRRARWRKLTLRTPEGTDDLVLVLDRTETRGRTWLRVRLPVRPNGTTGWVPESALSELQPVIDLAADQHQDVPHHAGQERQDRVQRADRRRAAAVADAARASSSSAPSSTGYGGAGSVVRAAGVHHQRHVAHADRLAGRRHRRRPWHERCRG